MSDADLDLPEQPAPEPEPASDQTAPGPVPQGPAEPDPLPPDGQSPPSGALATGEPSPSDEELTAELEAAVDADIAALEQVERERDEYLDALRHLQADFENYKKRMVRQQTEMLERAGVGVIEKLLPVLDAVDLARQHGASEGVEQIAGALVDVLRKEGLERIDPVGQPFDPNEHEAVVHEPGGDDHDGEPVVAALMRAGYRWKGRLLRPAMVSVRG